MKNDYGAKPKLDWVPLDDLHVNETYQRSITGSRSRTLINKIAAEFAWSKFQPPTITRNKDGAYDIIDGQHRVAAARKCEDITSVPCYIVETDFTLEQAESFIGVNKDRIRMHNIDLYNAQLAAAEPMAIQIKNACDVAGVEIPKTPTSTNVLKPHQTMAVKMLERVIRNMSIETLTNVLKAIRAAYPDETGELSAFKINHLCRFYHAQNGAITLDDLVDFLQDTDLSAMKTSAQAYCDIHGGSMATAIYKTIEAAYKTHHKQKTRHLKNQ